MARYIDADRFYKNAKEMAATQPPWHQKIILGLLRASERYIEEDVEKIRHAKWRLNNDGSGTCGNCGFTQVSVWDMDNSQHYCGVCGAKMDGGN